MAYKLNPFTGKHDFYELGSPEGIGVYVGVVAPTLQTYAQWLASRTGYWAWIDISGEAAGGVTATVMYANASGSINPLAAGYSRYIAAVINPSNAVGSIAALVASVAEVGAVSAEVKAANADGMVFALTAAYARYMVGTVNPALAAGAINKLVASYARYMAATVGVAAATGAVNALVATVAASGGTETFNSSTTWQAPAGVTSVTVECWGSGNNGSDGDDYGSGGNGGGGGAYASKVVTVTPGNTYTVHVDGQSAQGSSWFLSDTEVKAASATAPSSGGTTANSIGTTKTAGSDGSPASGNHGGNGGNAGGSGGTGGAGGASLEDGSPGTAPGAGGGGGGEAWSEESIMSYGGSGAAGRVKLTW